MSFAIQKPIIKKKIKEAGPHKEEMLEPNKQAHDGERRKRRNIKKKKKGRMTTRKKENDKKWRMGGEVV